MGDLTVMQRQEVAKGAQAMGAIMGRQARRRAEKLTAPLPALSFWGKALAVAGFIAALTFAGLIVTDSSQVAISRGKVAVVARDTVNVRQTPSTRSSIVMKVHDGDRLTITGGKDKWSRVRSADIADGWVAKSLIDTRTGRTLNINYEMKGYGIALLISMLIVFFALRMKKVPMEQPSAGRRENSALINTDQ